ncbi:MAG: hypothetical protein KME21_13395 [Desmonostoc vinosum HA7617-LM4]|jgi:hypothetical protein|nr:hypothetical protein [Desmonostoc vinosum HA7617-LM4]
MAEPILTDVFGPGATQTATTITILKADLPGLTAAANNKADSLLVGLALRWQIALTETLFNSDTDRSIYIGNGYPNFAYRGTNNAQYRVDQLTINLARIDTFGTIDPDDY